MLYETKNFKISFIRLSSDRRTNVWKVICKKCNSIIYPKTTMLSEQYIKCKCGNNELVNYNKL